MGTLAAELCRGERRSAQERIRRAVGRVDVRVGV
jgi:hypothetical protein